MKKLGIAAILLGLLCMIPSSVFAQVKGVYWTTSGKMGPFPLSSLVPSLPKEKDRDVTIPVNISLSRNPPAWRFRDSRFRMFEDHRYRSMLP